MFGARRLARPADARAVRASASRCSAASRWSIFAVIFFRLWYLEVLSGDHYLAEAQNNQVREVTVQAPRGEILDRDGKVLVEQPDRARAAGPARRAAAGAARARRACSTALAEVAGMTPDSRSTRRSASRPRSSPASPVTLQARRPLRRSSTSCARTRSDFPGRHASSGSTCASYPQGDARRAPVRLRPRGRRRAAQGARATRRSSPGDEVGQAGRRVHLRQPAARGQRRHPRPGRRRRAADRRPAQPCASPRPATTSC